MIEDMTDQEIDETTALIKAGVVTISEFLMAAIGSDREQAIVYMAILENMGPIADRFGMEENPEGFMQYLANSIGLAKELH